MRQRIFFYILPLLLLALVACQASQSNETPTTANPAAQDQQPIQPTTESSAELIPTATQTFIPVVETASATATSMPSPPPPPTATTAPTPPPGTPVDAISLAPVLSGGLLQPVYLTHAFDDRLFVVEKPGAIRIVENGQLLPDAFLNIEDLVGSIGSEQGLLSVAFHPDYAAAGAPGAGIFFVYYTDNDGDTVVSHYRVSTDDPNRADESSEVIILQVEQPYENHNGGLLKFGPGGYLYVGLGDGGSGGDPQNHGQNLATLLGSILRLDVSQPGASYAIPADNPFVDDPNARPEIWAFGLRNPWRFSFDRLTGDLYLADVGQNMWEELSFQPASSTGGENYGWNIMEANTCYDAQTCDQTGLVLPIFDYDHSKGCSITGGYVYRGQQFPALSGNYFVGDYCSGIIWRLFLDDNGRWLETEFPTTDHVLSSFGEDVNGELYILAYTEGAIYQIQPAD